MAAWYLDNAASGANDGTSWADAWQTTGAVVWGASGVDAGDTLYISGGATSKTYTAGADGEFTITADGSAGSPITVTTGARAPDPGGHDGQVIFDGASTYFKLLDGVGRSYITIDGEKDGRPNWKFQNCTTIAEAAAVEIPSFDNSKLLYVEIETVGMGVWAVSCDYQEIAYCRITDVRNDTAIRMITGNAGATEYGRSLIHHCHISVQYDTTSGDGADGIQSSTSTDIYNNYFTSAAGNYVGTQHMDCIQSAGPYQRIYNNEIRNYADSACDVDGTGNWGEKMHNIWFYNNLVVIDTDYTGPAPAFSQGFRYYNSVADSTIDDVVICNNTFVDMWGDGSNGGNQIDWTMVGSETITNCTIKNNLFYNIGASSSYFPIRIQASSNAVAADYNVDYNLRHAGSNGQIVLHVDGATHTQTNDNTSEPSFVKYTARAPGNIYRLAAGDTAARNAGDDLSALFTTSKNGVTRPTGASSWDVGCFEEDGPESLLVWSPVEAEPLASAFATLDWRNAHPVLDFDGASNESAVFSGVMPQSYGDNGVEVVIHYSSAGTAGDADWDVALERIGDQKLDVDSDSFVAVNSTDGTTVPGTSGNVDVISVPFQHGADMDDVVAGDLFRVKITRDAASDTSTDDLEIHAVELREL